MQPIRSGPRAPAYDVAITLTDALRRVASDDPDGGALIFLGDGDDESVRLTRRDVDRRSRAVAATLQDSVAPGDRALILQPSGPGFVESYLGCVYAGVTPVPCEVSGRGRGERLAAIAQNARASVVLASERIRAMLETRDERPPALAGIPWLLTDAVADGMAGRWREPAVGPDTLALLQYTSGSTSLPRGVMVTHANILSHLRDMDAGWGHPPESVMVTWLPLFHDMGLIYALLQPIAGGFPCVMMPPAAFLQRPVRWLRAITRYRATHSAAPNFAYDLCVRRIASEQKADLDLRSWRIALNAAEPIRAETLDRFAAAFAGCGFDATALSSGYGLAEATSKVTTTPADRPVTRLRLDADALARHEIAIRPGGADDSRATTVVGCGVPVPETEVRIVDPDTGLPSATDRVGEIWVRGRVVARGYWGDAAATDEVFGAPLDGAGEAPFLRTGDFGFCRGDELFVTGRLKDLIIVGGLNYYPQDIERTVERSHAALSHAGAAAFALDDAGEERLVVAVEVERAHLRSLDAAGVFGAIRSAVASEHGLAIHAVALLKPKTLPKTSSGKVRRRACRAAFLQGQLEVVAERRASRRPAEADIRAWLIERFAERLGVSPASIDPRASLSHCGVDSAEAVALSVDLETWLGRPIAQTLAYDHPTIDAIARHFATEPEAGGAAVSVEAIDRRPADAIAVIGLGCRFPGASHPEAFWQLLRDGRDAITRVDASRWASADVPEATFGGFLEDPSLFDPGFFGIAPHEADRTDPQQRLVVEVCWEALEDAGAPADRLAGTRTGVFLGISNSDYARLLLDSGERDLYLGTGGALSIAANRLSYLLDLRGPSVAVDTACSSSLVAVTLACQSLRRGECDLALAGGVNLILSPAYTVAFSKAQMMAPDGRCKAFSASADGYVRGEGAGVVVLKRLGEAEAAGDRIDAVIRGVAINQDGRTTGLTAPNGTAQRAVVAEALRDAGLAPARVSYVEAHGTGTPLGDPIEINALKDVLLEGRPPDAACRIGSVKTNIGHLESAAGIAGLMKTVLALRHREIPPSLHCRELNPRLEIAGTPMQIAARLEPWTFDGPRRVAGVSSFGFGGTNAHVVLEEPAEAPIVPAGVPDRPFQVLTLSGRDPEGVANLADRYVSLLLADAGASFEDACFTSTTGRAQLPYRLAVVARSRDEARQGLESWREAGVAPQVAQAARVVFLYTGQGPQYPSMGLELYRREPVFRDAIHRCDDILRPLFGGSIAERLYGDDPDALKDMRVTQPAIFTVQYALTELWSAWGVRPAAVMGHSLGEYAAAWAAGILTLEDALRLVAARGRLLDSLPPDSAMVSAMAGPDLVEEAIAPYRADLAVAAINSPTSTVFAGRRAAAEEAAGILTARGIRCTVLNIAQASHSPAVEAILDAFAAEAAEIPAADPTTPFVSNLTGDWRRGPTDTRYWRRHLRAPVLFQRGLETLRGEGYEHFLEVGPHPTLSAFGEQIDSGRDGLWLASLHRDEPPHQRMLASLGALWTHGVPVDWQRFHEGRRGRKVSLPTYPFKRRRCWIPASVSRVEPVRAGGHPRLGRRVHLATDPELRVIETRASELPGRFSDHQIAGAFVLSASAYLEMLLEALDVTEPRGWQFEQVAFLQPLRLADGIERVIQTIASPDRSAGFACQIASRADHDEPATWLVHVTAGMRRSGEPPPAAIGVSDGPPISEALDAIVGAAAAALPSLEGTRLYVPIGIDRLSIHRRPGKIWRTTVKHHQDASDSVRIDVWLSDDDGVAIALEGLIWRPVDRDALNEDRADRYRIEWIDSRRPTAAASSRAQTCWLILTDDGGTGESLARHLRAAGDLVATAARGEYVDDVQLLDAAARELGRPLDAIVHLRGLDVPAVASTGAYDTAIACGAGSAVRLAQALLTGPSRGRLWLVTRSTQRAGGAESDAGLWQAPIWGVGKTLALEAPDQWGGLIDLDAEDPDRSARRLADELLWQSGRTPARAADDHVAFRGDRRLVARVDRIPPCRPRRATVAGDATYLLTGGLGTLGLAVAKRLVAAGARHLVLVGSTGASTDERRSAVRALEEAGAEIWVRAADVRSGAAVGRLVSEMGASLPPLRGIVHAAGRGGYRLLREMTCADLDDALGAKVLGALVLREAVEGVPLDFFISVSSMVSAWGAPGQAHYAAANHFLDLLASRAGAPFVTVGLGPMRGGALAPSVAANMERAGVAAWSADRAAAVLLGSVDGPRHQIAAEIDWSRYAAAVGAGGRLLLERVTARAPMIPARGALADRLRQLPPNQQHDALADAVTAEVGRVLGMRPEERVDERRGFFDLGMDSLMALELRKRLEVSLDRRLPATLAFDCPNTEALVAFLGRTALEWAEPREAVAAGAVRPAALESSSRDRTADLLATLERVERLADLR